MAIEQAKLLNISLLIDPLSWVMLLSVGFLSSIILSYSIRYCHYDHNRFRFMAQLTFLILAVFLLVTSGNLLTAFIAWQLIGLGLYLLLNHFHYNLQANKAAKKKFIINRLGDLSFLTAVILMMINYQSTEFSFLAENPNHISTSILLLLTLAVFTKAAQFPFHIWLIDTMEAPTPVSAIMHAGVINAGGFLLARLSPALTQHPSVMAFIACCGLMTVLTGVFMKRGEASVKRQLAYSTMSQMGYMILQCGVGCFASAVFHLISHGFYKAYLFLNSGSELNRKNLLFLNKKNLEVNCHPRTLMAFSLVLSLLLVVVAWQSLLLLGVENRLNPVLWLFIAITLTALFRQVMQSHVSVCVKSAAFLVLTALFFFYIAILSIFTTYLEPLVVEQSQLVLGLVLTGGIITAYCVSIMSRQLVSDARWQRFQHFCYRLSANQLHIEEGYRRLLIGPIRSVGETLLSNKFVSLGLFALMLPLAMFAQPAFFSAVLILLLLISNRIRTVRFTAIMLFIISVFLCVMLIDLHNLRFPSIVPAYLLHHLSITILVLWIIYQCRKHNKKINAVTNKLPVSHFYIASLMMLTIGIPGTVSFQIELALIATWLEQSLLATLLICLSMVLLALVVLHTLQEHIFNPDTRLPGNGLPWLIHVAFWIVFGLNVAHGVSIFGLH